MPNYFNAFNVFECRRNILDGLDVSYEKACMATERNVYFTKMLDSLLSNNERYGTPLSSKNIQDTVIIVMEEEEGKEEKYAKNNVNNVTMDNFFNPFSLSMNKRKMQT